MPFRPDPFLEWFEPLRRLRQRPLVGYAVAVGAVAVATVLRLGFPGLLGNVPFITFFPAIAAAGVVGGTRPGILALVLSVLSADYLILAPVFGSLLHPVLLLQTLLFILVASLILGLIALLNQAIDRVWNIAENSRLILEAQPTGILGVDQDGRITLVNAAVERQLGYAREELLDRSVDELVPLPQREGHPHWREAFMRDPELRPMGAGRDLNAVAKDGSLLPVEIGLAPVGQGRKAGTLATIIDISERKALERRAETLTNEVRHRARNLLTIVQALASRKLPRETSGAFIATLAALARTHDVFAEGIPVSLRGIVEGELSGFRDQLSLSGCDVELSPRAGQDFTLIVHELATNALKHGALSTAFGRVTVSGREDGDGDYHFLWEEAGGPPVEPPPRDGFGQTILRGIAASFCTDVEIAYPPEGLRYALSVPVDRIATVAQRQADTA